MHRGRLYQLLGSGTSEGGVMKHVGDIIVLKGNSVEPTYAVSDGSPCQGLSVAGKRLGLEDERSGLFMEGTRVVKEMREEDMRNGRTGEHVRPRWLIWENVPGAFSSNGGEDFLAVLEEIARIRERVFSCSTEEQKGEPDRWEKAGCILEDDFSIAWRVIDAQHFGNPQRRARICLVADFAGHTAPDLVFVESFTGSEIPTALRLVMGGERGCTGEVQPECESLSGYLKPCDTPWKGIATDPGICAEVSDRNVEAERSTV